MSVCPVRVRGTLDHTAQHTAADTAVATTKRAATRQRGSPTCADPAGSGAAADSSATDVFDPPT
ncbi:hypothetical protein GCM10010532_018190 [Dactylosporangium siamense]|uniref:Uncharacterized protein n=1 Tax=Dactylosporangium siamense TaxID=685454 RepID=A0A919PQT2_9ACTN|nr:hypothetical protein Dsi01nite_065730 [Dactylosporangium siamense]